MIKNQRPDPVTARHRPRHTLKPYKTYSKAFKLEALRLMEESDRPASEVAIQLGSRRNQLYKWKEQMKKNKRAAPFVMDAWKWCTSKSDCSKIEQDHLFMMFFITPLRL